MCALLMGAAAGVTGRLVSGSRDSEVIVWDLRAAPTAARVCGLGGVRGRACSLAAPDPHTLYVGDYSSTVKVRPRPLDLRNYSLRRGKA